MRWGNTMGWESRNGRGSYYTRSRKVHGRVVREYFGAGAALAAELDCLRRGVREAERAAWRGERAQVEMVEVRVEALWEAVERLMQAELTVAGYHQHARGEWRRRSGEG